MNSVNLIGSLTEDPRLDVDPQGLDRCAMRIAVGRRARGGGAEPGVVYVDVLAFGAQALDCAERLVKGRRVGVSGLIDFDEWRDEGGERRARHDVVADSVNFLDPPPEPEAEAEEQPRRRRRPRRKRKAAS
jgi:single-strand DNA-binding protein